MSTTLVPRSKDPAGHEREAAAHPLSPSHTQPLAAKQARTPTGGCAHKEAALAKEQPLERLAAWTRYNRLGSPRHLARSCSLSPKNGRQKKRSRRKTQHERQKEQGRFPARNKVPPSPWNGLVWLLGERAVGKAEHVTLQVPCKRLQ